MSGAIECCANCSHLVPYPRNNRYNDIDYLCTCHGYFTTGNIHRDRTKVEHYTPGGRKLECNYKRKKERKNTDGRQAI